MKKWIYTSLMLVLIIVLGFLIMEVIPESKSPSKEKPVEPEEEIVENLERRASIVMVGDALIHDSIYKDAYKGNNVYDFSQMFTYIEPIIQEYDIRYYNQESIIGGKRLGISTYPRFNSPDEIGETLVSIGFNLVSLANNHTLDKNEAGVLYSVNFWKKQEGVYTAGSYESWEERNRVTIFEKKDITFAFLSYTMRTNGLKPPSGKEYLINVYSDDIVAKDIEKAKNNAEVIIVAIHWGDEYKHTPNAEQKRIATYLSNLGVHLIIGAHPHVVQPVGYINETLVIYSLGNFIAAQRTIGIDKMIGLMVGVEIVVDEDSNVSFENLNYKLTYTYSNNFTNYKVIPFENLTEQLLRNYKALEEEYLQKVEKEVSY